MESQNEPVAMPGVSFFIQAITKHETYGRLAKLLLPSGNTVLIREQNGNDDDILSSFGVNDLDSSAINRFIAAIIIQNSFEFSKSKTSITATEALNILLNDKYFILIASRAFSLGEEFEFQWDWKGDTGKVSYNEDLKPYLWDYSQSYPEEGEENYFKYRIPPYYNISENGLRELTLSTGKKIRYKYLDGHGEDFLLKRSPEERTANASLKARKLSLYNPDSDKFQELPNFSAFTSKEMAEIRKDLREKDPQFDGITEITNPKTGEELSLPLIGITDFFFPREI
jgi:hypothetical protein